MDSIVNRLELLTKRVLEYSAHARTMRQALEIEEEKVARLEQRLALKDERIKELEEQNKLMKVAGTLQGDGGGNLETKGKINELVREIDKCIALLNG